MPVYKDEETNTYYCILNYKDPITGRWKQKKKRGFKKLKDAKAAMAELENALNQREYAKINPKKMTLGSLLTNWLNYKKMTIRKSTLQTYQYYIKSYIEPTLAKYQIADITPALLQLTYSQLVAEYSPATVKKTHAILYNALELATKWEYIPNNPATLVEPPKVSKPEIKVWDIETATKFLRFSASENERTHIAYVIAIMCGLRQGEILGLRWSDVDMKKKIMYIRQTLSHDGKRLENATKTAAGTRSVAFSDVVLQELIKHKKLQARERLRAGSAWQDNNLVVTTSVGTPLNPRSLLRSFKRITRNAGLPEIRFHDLRHTHATALLSAGINPKIVSERLGHSSVEITLDVYSHLLPNMQSEAAEAIERQFKGIK